MFQRIEEWILNVGFCLSFLIYFAVSILSELNKNNTKNQAVVALSVVQDKEISP